MPNNKKNKNVAQSFDDGYRTFSRPIKKFGPGDKDPYKSYREREQKRKYRQKIGPKNTYNIG